MTPIPSARRRCASLLLWVFAHVAPLAVADTPPSVTSDPAFQDVALGASLLFAPVLTGDPVTGCQWFKDGAPIAGATSSTFSIPAAAATDAGYYTATFTNGAGATKAAVAAVQIGGVPIAPDTSATSYRLMDYFYPRIEGAEWLYAGLDSVSHTTVHTRVAMADLDREVTCYTGRYSPQPYQVTTPALDGAYGSYAGGVFTPTKTWTDFMGASEAGVVMWGDDYAGGESVRLDGAYNYPATMRLGQTYERTADYYEHGVFACPVTAFFQLLSVDTVDTPAGRFQGSLHVRITLLAPGNTRQWDEWWVSGLGKVRNRWLSGSGLRADSLLVSSEIPAGVRYRLADYFVPRAVGAQFAFDGTNWSGNPARIGTRVVGLGVPITTYTGFPLPTPVGQPVMALERSSLRTDVPSTIDTWFEYYTTPSNISLWGMDDDPGTQEIRFENGFAMPADIAVGETASLSRYSYLNGMPVGPASFSVQLLGVEDVAEPAGTFANTLHLRFTLVFAGNTEVHDEWMAPGVGAVRYRMVSGPGHLSGDLASWAVPSAPALSSQSTLETCPLNGTARLAVMAVGTGPLTFQWYRGSSGDVATPVASPEGHAFTTPALTAWTRYWVRVSNAVGSVDSDTMLVMPTGGTMTLAEWVLLDGIPANQRGGYNTPAGDGVINRMKFALGLTPMADATRSMPKPVIVAGTGADRYLALDFARNPKTQGLRFSFETSSDLITWNEVTYTWTLFDTMADGRQNVRMRSNLPVGTDTRRFGRLKVSPMP